MNVSVLDRSVAETNTEVEDHAERDSVSESWLAPRTSPVYHRQNLTTLPWHPSSSANLELTEEDINISI